jgi:ABC-type phosphate transport system permease subunit
VLVIGDSDTLGKHIFDQGYTLAAVIANEFGEAANQPLHSSALFAAGLVLFVLTLIVNAIARWFVTRGTRGMRAAPDDDAPGSGLMDVATASAPGPA